MHKKMIVAEIVIDDITASITEINKVYALEHLPVGTWRGENLIDRASLNSWWIGRSIPASRSGIREALEVMNVPFTQSLLVKCYGLSLSDQYWINPIDAPLDWDKINFFDNSFSDDVGNALFSSLPMNEDIDLMSPDNTSDGWLKKKWKIIDNKRCLIKGGSNPAQQEPLNEVLATNIMNRLNISNVSYSLLWIDELPYSVCEDFITRDTELVSAWSIMNIVEKGKNISLYQHFIECCDTLGIPNVTESIDNMLTVDYIIANEDRHLNNFGAIRNVDTLEWEGMAPIFDCGTSMWYNKFTKAINAGGILPSRPFKNKHNEQIKLVSSFDNINIESLDGIVGEFADILSTSSYSDALRNEKLCTALQMRIDLLSEHIMENTQNNCSGIVME